MKLSALLFPILLASSMHAIQMPPKPQGVPFTGNPNELQMPTFIVLTITPQELPLMPDGIDPKIIAAQLMNTKEQNVEEQKELVDAQIIVMRKKNKNITDEKIANLESICRVLQMKIPEPENENSNSQNSEFEILKEINSNPKYIKHIFSQINQNISPEEFQKQTLKSIENWQRIQQQVELLKTQQLKNTIEILQYQIEQFQKYKEETTN